MEQSHFEKLIAAQLVKKLPTFMELRGSLPCLQQPANGPYSEPDKSSPHPHNLLSLRSTLISSSHLQIIPPGGFFLSGFQITISHFPSPTYLI
jgi:hypothetical protein